MRCEPYLQHSSGATAASSLSPQVIKKTFCPDRSIVTAVKVCASGLLSTADTTGTTRRALATPPVDRVPNPPCTSSCDTFPAAAILDVPMAAGRQACAGARLRDCGVGRDGERRRGQGIGHVRQAAGRSLVTLYRDSYSRSTADDEDVLEEPIEAPPVSAPSPRELHSRLGHYSSNHVLLHPNGATTAVPAGYSTTPYNTNAPGNAGRLPQPRASRGRCWQKVRRMPIRRRAA